MLLVEIQEYDDFNISLNLENISSIHKTYQEEEHRTTIKYSGGGYQEIEFPYERFMLLLEQIFGIERTRFEK